MREARKGSTEDITEDITEDVAVPSQAALFRGIGEKLGIGRKKGEVNLNTIIYFVQETADLDNLLSVWQDPWFIWPYLFKSNKGKLVYNGHIPFVNYPLPSLEQFSSPASRATHWSGDGLSANALPFNLGGMPLASFQPVFRRQLLVRH